MIELKWSDGGERSRGVIGMSCSERQLRNDARVRADRQADRRTATRRAAASVANQPINQYTGFKCPSCRVRSGQADRTPTPAHACVHTRDTLASPSLRGCTASLAYLLVPESTACAHVRARACARFRARGDLPATPPANQSTARPTRRTA